MKNNSGMRMLGRGANLERAIPNEAAPSCSRSSSLANRSARSVFAARHRAPSRERRWAHAVNGAILFCALTLFCACVDPVRDGAIEKLGPEKGGVPPGPEHRPGQPCLLCHSDDGEAGAFTIAGTVYLDLSSNTPVDNVQVTAFDSKGMSFTATTNCAGNFFVRPQEFAPTFPIWLEMQGGETFRSMESQSYREGSCAACHTSEVGPSSPGPVYLLEDPTMETPPPSRCQ
jgi:hypothetical protein